MTQRFYLYEQDGVDASGAAVTWRFAETGYNHPSAPGYYDGRLAEVGLFQRSIHSDGTFGGRSEAGYGVLTLLNGDHALDGFVDLAIDGWPFRIYMVAEDQPYASAVLVLSGVADEAVPAGSDGNELQVYLYDRQQLFDTPLQTRTLGGTNSGGDGLDGDSEQAGDFLPIAYGPQFNVEPVLVNAEKQIWCLHDGPIHGNLVGKDGGVPIPLGVQRSSAAELEANQPAEGMVDWFLGAEDAAGTATACAYVRLRTPPAHDFTVDFDGAVRQGVYLQTGADIVRDIAVHRIGLAAADVFEVDFAALNGLQPAAVGRWLDDDTDAAAILDDVTKSIGAWWGFDRLGRLRLTRIEDPATLTPVMSIRRFGLGAVTTAADACLISYTFEKSSEAGWGPAPAYAALLRYDHNPTQQSSGDLGGTTDPTQPDPVGGATVRDRLADEWRLKTWPADSAVGDTIRARHKFAGLLEIVTYLRDGAAAQGEVDRRGALHAVPHRTVTIQVALDDSAVETVDLGRAVTPDLDGNYGWDGSRIGVVTGIGYDLRAGTASWTVWG